MTTHRHTSTRTTGNEEISGIDPGGTRSTHPGGRNSQGEPSLTREIESGDRNVNPGLMQRLPHGEVVMGSQSASANTKGHTMADSDALHDLYVTGLRNAYAMETQAIELISRQVERLKSYPEMEDRMRRHLQESEAQRQRIDSVLSGMNESHSSLKSAAMGLLGNLAALGHTPAPDEVVKNTIANYAFEHYEMAAYRSLLALGEALPGAQGLSELRESLKEEEGMAAWIDGHIGPTTLAYARGQGGR
ncbi:ferritin-like domain-containing protein [Acidisoma sp. 7E03]